MQVRQQTLDIAALIRITRQSFSEAPPRFVLLMEDDWLVCPSALLALQYLLDKAYAYDEDWLALRVSYGFNGVVVRGGVRAE